MAVDIKQLELLYFVNNKKVPYKLKCGVEIELKPILVEDWGIFESCIDVIRINKNEINDINILQMSYLEFLGEMTEAEINQGLLINLAYILKYSIDVDYFSIERDNNGKTRLVVCKEDGEILYFITPKEFDDIRKIILHQNIPNYDDRYIDPEIRRAIEAYNKTKMKNQVSPTFEKQKVFVISKTGMTEDKINKMTYRTFAQVYSFNIKEDLYLSRTMYKTSQKYEIKEEIIHPLFEKEQDIMDEIFVDADSFAEKIKNGNS